MTTVDVINAILQAEGWPAVTDRPADRGGLTKGGITLMALSRFRGAKVTAEQLINLTDDEARALYLQNYVRVPGFDQIADESLRAFLVDYAVNSGQAQAISDLQRALGVLVDGVFGGETEAAARASRDPRALLVTLIKSRSVFLHHLALHDTDVLAFLDAHPTAQLHNLNGWNNRVLNFVD